MATTTESTQCRPPARNPACCPDCGALECLCRPRFFAGQLLSEQDLNRLDQYIRNKHRLHTRNLHGWGVVNGLLVVCDPCGDVKVTQGYAVDPCGDDIVVCEETSVGLCDLIRKCKQADPQPECQPFREPRGNNCDDLVEEWVLTVSYQEWASRGVTALRGNSCGAPGAGGAGNACGCGGDCGCAGGTPANGKSSAGCGCGTTATPTAGTTTYRGAPPECEPTVTCEGYRFGVYRKPENEDPRDDDDQLVPLQGAFWEAFNCCAQPLIDAVPPMPQLDPDGNLDTQAAQLTQWCCRFRDNLLKYFQTHRNVRCEIIDYLLAVTCPSASNLENYEQLFLNAYLQLISAWAEGVRNCLCLALLPPPPPSTCDTRVPLASIRVRARDCKVLSICNWTTERQMMVTWPAMAHWVGILPIMDFIRDLLDEMCCNSLLGLFDDIIDDVPGTVPGTATQPQGVPSNVAGMTTSPLGSVTPAYSASVMQAASGRVASRFAPQAGLQVQNFSRLLGDMQARGSQPLQLGAVLNAVSPRFRLPDNGQPLSEVEARNLPLLIVGEVAVKPFLDTVLGSGKAEHRMDEFRRELSGEAPQAGTSAVEKELRDLRLKVELQDAQLKTLLKNLNL
ncbi:hypothetical protein E4634_01085 [Mangrovimicrobium sediminis]|uniref:Uncharacterized protein n=1 Tax=Mangrovimicrobium sediminis TaxID=2562682 RepID=A0A4Z0M8X8_9GAMM|nr:hypothetical protein [Haliea sp. SAOS-164]TGD76172.1 hypothetical protein E4634_01085 [Haliea sp. SAOS-164]